MPILEDFTARVYVLNVHVTSPTTGRRYCYDHAFDPAALQPALEPIPKPFSGDILSVREYERLMHRRRDIVHQVSLTIANSLLHAIEQGDR
jgi:hypothetical protein